MNIKYQVSDLITQAIDQTKNGGDSQKAIALALVAVAAAIEDAGMDIGNSIERAAS